MVLTLGLILSLFSLHLRLRLLRRCLDWILHHLLIVHVLIPVPLLGRLLHPLDYSRFHHLGLGLHHHRRRPDHLDPQRQLSHQGQFLQIDALVVRRRRVRCLRRCNLLRIDRRSLPHFNPLLQAKQHCRTVDRFGFQF